MSPFKFYITIAMLLLVTSTGLFHTKATLFGVTLFEYVLFVRYILKFECIFKDFSEF